MAASEKNKYSGTTLTKVQNKKQALREAQKKKFYLGLLTQMWVNLQYWPKSLFLGGGWVGPQAWVICPKKNLFFGGGGGGGGGGLP